MIRLQDVVKSYGRSSRAALDGIDLRVAPGEFVFLVGESGSGKSTVIRLLLREEKVTSGHLEVAGRDVTRLPRRHVPRLRRDIGVVFQDYRLLPDKNVADNLAYVLHVLGAHPRQVRRAVPRALDLVGLAGLERRLPIELSGGEQQRVAIARAVVTAPALLLADEPTGNLDPATSRQIVTLLTDLNDTGTTVLMATHDDQVVNRFGRRVVELHEGKIVRDEESGAYTAAFPAGRADNAPAQAARR